MIKVTDYLTIFFGLLFIGFGFWEHYAEKDFKYQFLFWIILGVTNIISGLINTGDYLILDSLGIKDAKFLKWDAIVKISKNQYHPTEIIFEGAKKNLIVDFYNNENIEEFKSIIKHIKFDFYEKYLIEL
ncbi:MAG: hypothetical protein ACERKD_13755 [Prolixibacteraceae bacterium]